MRIRSAIGTALVLLTTLVPVAARAVGDYNVAGWKKDRRARLVRQLDGKKANFPHLLEEPLFVLFDDRYFDVQEREHTVTQNVLLQVQDAEAVVLPTHRTTISHRYDIEDLRGWILRDGKEIELKEDVWRVVEGDDEKLTEIFFTFPELRDGDVIGYSLEYKMDRGWYGGYLPVAGALPIMMCRTRLKTNGEVAYNVSAYHLRKDCWTRKIHEKDHGIPCDLHLTMVDIPRRPQGEFAPTWFEYEPYLRISRRGRWNQPMGAWLYNVSWNEVVANEHLQRLELDKQARTLIQQASRLIAGAHTAADQAATLHRFVRDEVVGISSFEVRGGERTLADVYTERRATYVEKGLLMYGLCRAAGLDVDLLVGRGRFSGEIDRSDPNGAQLIDYVIRLKGEPDLWYTPQFTIAAAGELPPAMRGVELLEIPAEMEKTTRDIWQELVPKFGGRAATMWNEYRAVIKKVGWAEWVTTPGDPKEIAARVVEQVTVAPGGEAELSLVVKGASPLQALLRSDRGDQEKLESYVGDRFGDYPVDAVSVEFAQQISYTLRARAEVGDLSLPPVMGDDWLLPGEIVHGSPVWSGWDAASGDPFLMRATQSLQLVWRAPLPDGWATIQAIPEFTRSHDQIRYSCRIFQDGSDLVVSRSLMLNQGITMYSDLPAFRQTLAEIEGYERSPLLIRRRVD